MTHHRAATNCRRRWVLDRPGAEHRRRIVGQPSPRQALGAVEEDRLEPPRLGDPARARLAMRAVEDNLVQTDASGLILLLGPPFDATKHDPGYIKGYVPSVRENGGH
jgi:hypothetical protein